MAIKKILSPVDFSDPSTAAVRTAETLAHKTGAELVLLHVLDDLTFTVPQGRLDSPRLIREYQIAMEAKLADLASTLRTDVVVSTQTAHGVAAQAILDAAEREHPDLVVMGTHGRTSLGRFFLGSVAERVLRSARMPVLTVRALQVEH